jgi:hypothetical protein
MLERELFRPLLSSCIYNTCLGFYWHWIENGAALNNNRKMFYHIYKLLGNWLINERLFSWWKCLTVRNIRCPSRWVKMNTPEESLQKTRDNVKYSQIYHYWYNRQTKHKRTCAQMKIHSRNISNKTWNQTRPIPSIHASAHADSLLIPSVFIKIFLKNATLFLSSFNSFILNQTE